MATRMQQRRGTAAQWDGANPILAAGEIGFESDSGKFKIGDGINHWADLVYYASAQEIANLIDGAPDLLNTLGELAAAIGDNANFSELVDSAITQATTDAISAADTAAAGKVSVHNQDTTDVHGIADTSVLVTQTNLSTAVQDGVDQAATAAGEIADGKISTHNSDTTSVHGISDTSLLVYSADLLSHSSSTENVHGISDTSLLVTTTGTETLSNKTLDNPTILVGIDPLFDTISATEIGYLDGVTSSIQTQLDAKATPSDISTHNDDTTSVHGITDTSKLVTTDSASQTIDGALTITGNLTVEGTTTTVSATNLEITDPLIYIGTGNSANANDLGLVAHFDNGVYQHSGLARDHADGKWKLFSGITTEPTNTLAFGEATFDTLKLGAVEFSDGTQLKAGVPSITTFATAISSSATLSAGEQDKFVPLTGAVTITLPATGYSKGQSIDFYQESGTGAQFASTNSVVGTPGLKFRTTNSVATAMKTESGWLVFGDLSA
jgi:hypothetical protein